VWWVDWFPGGEGGMGVLWVAEGQLFVGGEDGADRWGLIRQRKFWFSKFIAFR